MLGIGAQGVGAHEYGGSKPPAPGQTHKGVQMLYLLVFFPIAIWMFLDSKRRRYDSGKWLAAATALIGPITAPIYFASRPLRKGESREGGRPWNLLKNFALFWTITMAICTVAGMVNVVGSADELNNDYERAGAAIGSVIGLGLLFFLWFFPMMGALVLGLFLKKSSLVETGPTGALVDQEELDYKLSDFADQLKSASQVAATKVQTLAGEITERATNAASDSSSNQRGAAELLKRARDLITSGKRDEAITVLKDIVAFFPDSPEAANAASTLQKAGHSV